MACLPTDTRGLILPGEVFSFFLQHSLLTFVPLYFLWRRRFEVPQRVGNIIANWAVFGLLHFLLFELLSLYLGDNINYIVQPPPGFDVFGRGYRIFITLASLLLMIILRFTIVQLFKYIGGRNMKNKVGGQPCLSQRSLEASSLHRASWHFGWTEAFWLKAESCFQD